MYDFNRSSAPETDAEAEASIRRIGYPSGLTESMIGLYRCRRWLGATVPEALERTLYASLPVATLEKLAPNVKGAAEELARRKNDAR